MHSMGTPLEHPCVCCLSTACLLLRAPTHPHLLLAPPAVQNNLADITAKGESVANLADILGTVAGIALSKGRMPLVPTFCVLSAGKGGCKGEAEAGTGVGGGVGGLRAGEGQEL